MGRLVFNFNSAEHQLRRIAFVLIDPDDQRTGEITIDKLGANGIEELVRALAPHRLAERQTTADHVLAAVNRFGDVRLRRNDLVHAVWVVPNEASDLENMAAIKSKFRKGTHTQVCTNSPELVASVATEASTLGQDLEQLYERLRKELPKRGVS